MVEVKREANEVYVNGAVKYRHISYAAGALLTIGAVLSLIHGAIVSPMIAADMEKVVEKEIAEHEEQRHEWERENSDLKLQRIEAKIDALARQLKDSQ